jgi:hypothetical protein
MITIARLMKMQDMLLEKKETFKALVWIGNRCEVYNNLYASEIEQIRQRGYKVEVLK